MKRSFTIHTRDGSRISVTPVGDAYDFHVKDSDDRTTATVVMSAADFEALRAELEVAA